MKDNNEEAFLKSMAGVSPIKKRNTLQKKLNLEKIPTFVQKKKISSKNNTPIKKEIKKNNPSFFKPEKTPINKKLKKGKIPVEKKIDFHGLSVLEAEHLFLETIVGCYKKNLRCVLFVTGKGILKKNNEGGGIKLYYGKIRNSFQLWVKRDEVQKYILSVQPAGIEYGADGAFFVYLRKQKLHFD